MAYAQQGVCGHSCWLPSSRFLLFALGENFGEIFINWAYATDAYTHVLDNSQYISLKKKDMVFKDTFVILIDLNYPISTKEEPQIVKNIQVIINQWLLWIKLGKCSKYWILPNAILYQIETINKEHTIPLLQKELKKYPIYKSHFIVLEDIMSESMISNLEKITSKNELIHSSKIKPIRKPLNESIYWSIVEKSEKETFTNREKETFLSLKLIKYSPSEIIGFYIRTYLLELNLDLPIIACADYLINNGGSGDDGFLDFRRWIISKGKNIYFDCQKNIDILDSFTSKNVNHHSFQSFGYVAHDALEIISGQELFKYIDNDIFTQRNSLTVDQSKSNYEEYLQLIKKNTLKKICPKLFYKFWNSEIHDA